MTFGAGPSLFAERTVSAKSDEPSHFRLIREAMTELIDFIIS